MCSAGDCSQQIVDDFIGKLRVENDQRAVLTT